MPSGKSSKYLMSNARGGNKSRGKKKPNKNGNPKDNHSSVHASRPNRDTRLDCDFNTNENGSTCIRQQSDRDENIIQSKDRYNEDKMPVRATQFRDSKRSISEGDAAIIPNDRSIINDNRSLSNMASNNNFYHFNVKKESRIGFDDPSRGWNVTRNYKKSNFCQPVFKRKEKETFPKSIQRPHHDYMNRDDFLPFGMKNNRHNEQRFPSKIASKSKLSPDAKPFALDGLHSGPINVQFAVMAGMQNKVTVPSPEPDLPLDESESESEPEQTEEPEIVQEVIKHPLESEWTWYYSKSRYSLNWDLGSSISTVKTIEDFWAVYNHVCTPCELPEGTDYSFFKGQIKPEWEDRENEKGGRWVLDIGKNQKDSLNIYWRNILLFLIGFEEKEFYPYLNGVVIGIRKEGRPSKLSLWLGKGDDEIIKKIGEHLKKEVLGTSLTIIYELHKDKKSGKATSRSSIWRV